MSWVGLRDPHGGVYSTAGLGRASRRPVDLNSILPRGTLTMTFDSDPALGEQTLIDYHSTSPWPSGLTLVLDLAGRLTLTRWQGDQKTQFVLQTDLLTRAREVQVTYTWDAPARAGMISVSDPEKGRFAYLPLSGTMPLSLRDAVWLMADHGKCRMTPLMGYAAIADVPAPHGPVPTLAAQTMIRTLTGLVPLERLKPGELVPACDGGIAQVRWVGAVSMPARGGSAPLTLGAPYHGATRDLNCAAAQRLRLRGPHVEYLFAHHCVSAQVGDLTGGGVIRPRQDRLVHRYWQFLLDRPVALDIGGLEIEGLDATILMRDPILRAASVLADLPAELLPRHADKTPQLRRYETATLCNLKAA